MNQQELMVRSQELFSSDLVSEALNQYNRENWIKAISFLGDKWVLLKPRKALKKTRKTL